MQRSNALQLKVTGALTALILGFAGAAAYVPRTLWSLTLEVDEVQHRHTAAVTVLAELRGCGRAMRHPAILAFHEPAPEARAAHEEEVARAREACEAIVERHGLAMGARAERPDPGGAAWEHFLVHDIPAHDAAVEAVLAESRLPAPDPRVLRELFETARDGDSHLQEMVALYSEEAERGAARIRAELDRLSSLYVGLAALGTVGALILLGETVRFVRRYARAVDKQVADLDAFGGHVAHDLRGPLQTISLAVGAIQKRSDDPAVQRLARGAASAVGRLDVMIRDLLQFARGGAALPTHARATVAAVIAETCDELRAAAAEAGVRLAVRADPALVAAVAPVALKAIVGNLVENAIKYRSLERQNEVDVTAAPRGGEVRITVSDRGPGIRPDVLAHLFEPFVRGSERPDSYGLGLATVKRLVDAHRGTIAVDSDERGTTFTLLLPAARGRGGPAAGPPPVVRTAPPRGARAHDD